MGKIEEISETGEPKKPYHLIAKGDLNFPNNDALLLELARFQHWNLNPDQRMPKKDRSIMPDSDNSAKPFQPIDEGARLEYGQLDKLSEATEPHFGKRLIAALEQLPDEMKNDPVYADPVGYVEKVRMGIDPHAPGSDKTVCTVCRMMVNGMQVVQHFQLNPEQEAAIKAGVGRVTPYGFSIGFTPNKPPATIHQNGVQLLIKNARALVRRLFRRQ